MSNSNKKTFFWGASSASHQVEGNNYNQWTVWEKLNADKLASQAEAKLSQLSNWKDIKLQATDPNNYISGSGVDHYNLYMKDFDLAKELNLNSLRFSIEWSRIEPENGKFDQVQIDYYKKYIFEMNSRGLEPFLNIWHWTEPVWFAKLGGFSKKKNVKYFDRFTKLVSDELLDGVKYVLILNEPLVYASMSYLSGDWPPNKKNPYVFLKILSNLVLAHKVAFKNLKAKNASIEIGIAAHITNFRAVDNGFLSSLIVRLCDYGWNHWFLNRTNKYLDFIGINHYFTNYFKKFVPNNNPKEPVSDLGWYMEPQSIELAINNIWDKYKKPIIISENGLADSKDKYRKWWINETMKALDKCKRSNVDIFGYLHWSLLDNFEWAYGWWPEFGLISVDRKDMSRKIRDSAKYYAKFIESKKHSP